MHKNNLPARFAFLVCLLAWCVVMLGAYTRLKDAGLGCPDWPGCYGQVTVPQTPQQLHVAQTNYPQQPVEAAKAWPEMVHRYFVGVLGFTILILSILSYRNRHEDKASFKLSMAIIAVVIFQALLGKWTVTLRLLPTVVMGHLLGGMTLLALLWLLFLRFSQWHPALHDTDKSIRHWGIIGLSLVGLQIFLGGWTSANYAALICPDFPLCRAQLIPPLDFKAAFNFFLSSGPNFQGGIFSESARMTIQFMHRLGGLFVFIYVSGLSIRCIFAKTASIRYTGILLFIILLLQIILGILNILLQLPIFVAVAHNGVAAILLLCTVTLLFQASTKHLGCNEKR
jgi:heme a synthase